MNTIREFGILAILLGAAGPDFAQIPKPKDAPAPLSPAESLKQVTMPPGYRLELIASEPMIREPSHMCWDEQGRLYICELHGYNYEGQLDIEELNKTGKLDREVRRYFVEPRIMEAAKKERYGTIKRIETDANGRAVKVTVFAERIPACYGMVPARGGLIVACGPDILYLADRDGDGVAEVRETLFTGFTVEIMERAINNPQWGLDGWIYFGRGQTGATITGPKLKAPVALPHTDFRIKADGSAIEPITGATKTIGFATTELNDRFVISTPTPALYVPPLPWNYLTRNPYAASSLSEVDCNPDRRSYPTSAPHPWRQQRADDPGFRKLYTTRYGIAEAAPNGYFTSLCSPIIYQDGAMPGLRGNLIACEPAQNMLYRLEVERTGDLPKVTRPKSEQKSEFLASRDIWFHPIALAHAPDGSLVIADFYREIIEDYSAIPRYLQQQYGLDNGKNHGRVWRLTHADMVKAPPADMSRLTPEQLAGEIISPHFWRRETARRLLVERAAKEAAPVLAALAERAAEPASILNILYTLDGLGELQASQVESALAHANPGVRVHALRLAERWLNDRPALMKKALALANDADAAVRLQVALSLGERRDPQALTALAGLAREHAQQRWMPTAILSSLGDRSGAMLAELLQSPKTLGQAGALLEPLCTSIAARRDPKELSDSLVQATALRDVPLQRICLRGFHASLKRSVTVSLRDEARDALKSLAASKDAEVRREAELLAVALKLEAPAIRAARMALAIQNLNDLQAPLEARLAAVNQLAFDDDPKVPAIMLAAVPTSTPQVSEAILAAVFSRREWLGLILDALEKKLFPPSTLSAIQRTALLENKDPAVHDRAATLLQANRGADDPTFRKYLAALANPRDVTRGEIVFRERCAICHQAHGLGIAVGPNLSSEFQRAEETIVKDILAPSDVISPGFTTYAIETKAGQLFSGVLAVESASSVTLRGPEGKEQIVLRKDIESLRALPVSLMPDDLTKVISPQDVANVIAWLRNPPAKVTLLDENPALAALLTGGSGTAEFIRTDKFSGEMCLRVTPPQRFNPKLPGWDYKIRENPGTGEYRYLRFAWKTEQGEGVLLELAANGVWPKADQPARRYFSGKNTTGWKAVQVSADAPRKWVEATVDLWKDGGNFTLTGIAPTAMGGPAVFDKIELLHSPKD